jgi:hypothetical protein
MSRKFLTEAAWEARKQQVWAAVFAAEWVRAFDSCASHNGFNHLEVDPYSDKRQTLHGHAERAWTMADLAVADMVSRLPEEEAAYQRQWQEARRIRKPK